MADSEMMHDGAQLALDTILLQPSRGIPSFVLHVMKHSFIERLAGVGEGEYRKDPVRVYRLLQRNVGTCLIDQWIPDNPLQMTDSGYDDHAPRGAATGASRIVCDGVVIDSPEAVAAHLEGFVFPKIRNQIAEFDENARVREIIDQEAALREEIGPAFLKGPYNVPVYPRLPYTHYGYTYYFMAYALYPELMERHFSLQADLGVLSNRAAARAFAEANLPPYCRTGQDLADSRNTLMDIRTLDKLWFPHFARAMEPIVKSGVRVVWHCDGNLMQMVPRLLDVGIKGFQGFQYECGMDLEKLSAMKTPDGENLILLAGISATDGVLRTGTPADVRRYLQWIVDTGPRTGLFLSSMGIYPDMPWENVRAYVDGLLYYREHGRSG